MRTWRVGSFSMGGALVFLGVFLMLQQFLGWDPAFVIMTWWPVLLIVLGVEILVYLWFFRKEDSRVKYDFISIIFIGVIGTAGIGMAILQSVGLLDLANQFVSAEVRVDDLPKYEEQQLDGITRIQVETGAYPIVFEGTDSKEISIFGTYRGETMGKKSFIEKVSDYAFIEKKGDTIFVKFKETPYKLLYGGNFSNLDITMLVPKNLKLEVTGGGYVNVNPRGIENNWDFNRMGHIEVKADIESNMKIDVRNTYLSEAADWEQIKQGKDDDDQVQSATRKYGDGKYLLTIESADSVSVTE